MYAHGKNEKQPKYQYTIKHVNLNFKIENSFLRLGFMSSDIHQNVGKLNKKAIDSIGIEI